MDQSEESQLEAAIRASLEEAQANTAKKTKRVVAFSDSDEEFVTLSSEDSEMEADTDGDFGDDSRGGVTSKYGS